AAICGIATPGIARTAEEGGSGALAEHIATDNDQAQSTASAADGAVATVVFAQAANDAVPAPGRSGAAPQAPNSAGLSASGLSAAQLAKQITNPVTDLWSLQFQFN